MGRGRGFESVRETFECCFTERGEPGAAVVSLANCRRIADLSGGDGFERDSPVNVYSVTKPMGAFCMLVLVDRGVTGRDGRSERAAGAPPGARAEDPSGSELCD